jgi:hypothetical protein
MTFYSVTLNFLSFFIKATLLSEIGQFITQGPAANLVYAND